MSDRSATPISRKRRRHGRVQTSAAGSSSAARGGESTAFLPWGRMAARIAAPAAVCLVAGAAAWADGTIVVSVRDGKTGTPLPNATVTLDETSGRELRHTIPTDQTGVATSPTLSDGNYQITISAVGYQKTEPVVVPLSGNTIRVDFALGQLKENVTNITAARQIIDPNDTTISTKRSQQFLKRFPITEGDRQSLPLALRSVPGFVWDGLNQIHPRGDQNGISLYVNGILIPQIEEGHISQFLTPEAFDTFKVITGGLSPEYGGQSGAAISIQTRPASDPSKPPTTPFRGYLEYGLSAGGYNSWDNYLNIGNTVRAVGFNRHPSTSASDTGFHRTLDYALSLGQHYSGNGIEPPQSSPQTPENHYSSEVAFGNVGLTLTPTLRLGLLFNYSSGRDGIADRLTPNGFLGLDPTVSTNQQDEGKKTRQKDNESFQFVTLTQRLKNDATVNLAIGTARDTLSIYEQNNSVSNPASTTDSSWEYYTNAGQTFDQAQFQADITVPSGLTLSGLRAHTAKFGFVYQDQRGNEGYYIAPRSLDAQAALTAALPPGFADATSGANHLSIKRTGSYSGLYAQDTWHLSNLPLVLNYGVRLDSYSGKNDFVQGSISKSELSPRVNLAYTLPTHGRLALFGLEPTVIRLGYDHLFTQPTGLGQGLLQGTLGISPEITDQYDLSIEHQFNLMQIAKLSLYTKHVKSVLDSTQLIPGLQDGAFGSINLGDATMNGFEFSYDYNPRMDPGPAGFFAFSTGKAKPKGGDRDSLGNPVTGYLDQDQRTTLSLGGSYVLPSGFYGGLTLYYGSGLYASTDPLYTGTGGRQTISELNLRLGTGPKFAQKHLGIELGIENLFDNRGRMDLRSAFAGTRYEQGRRVTLGLTGKL